MADNKKYYYLKLKEGFFDSDEMIVLESMPDGYLYSNILLKLYLRSLKYHGRLMFNDRIPFNSTMLAQVTRHTVGTIEKAMKIFQELCLVDVLDNGAIYMTDIQNFIGKSSSEADRVREYRLQIESEKSNNKLLSNNVQQKLYKCTPEIEIEIEIENRDRERDRKNSAGAKRRAPHFSPPSLQEVQEYCKERGNNIDAESFIDFYESKGWMVGSSKMKNWKAAVRTWENREKKVKGNGKELGETGTDYSVPDDWA